MKLPNNVDQLQ